MTTATLAPHRPLAWPPAQPVRPLDQPAARPAAAPGPRRVLRGPRGASHHAAGGGVPATGPAMAPAMTPAMTPAVTVRPVRHGAGSAPRRVGGLRLTARGRVVLLLVTAALALLALSVGRAASQAAPEGAGAGAGRLALEQVTVQPGETLWAIARRVAPGSDPRQVTAQLMRLNRLPGPQLRAGQQLLLPTG